MKLQIERSALLRSLGHVQNVVERRTTIPLLANVKLDASDNRLGLTATDLDLTLLASEPAEIERTGMTTIPAHTLFDIVRKLPEGSAITLDQTPGRSEIEIRAGRSIFDLPCLPGDEFPSMNAEIVDVTFKIAAADLIKLIDKTRFAISTEETRYYLNGIHFHASGAGATRMLRAVATDGHRLARVEVGLPAGADQFPPIIVPRKTITEMRKLLEEAEDEVTVGVSPSRIQLTTGGAVLLSRLIDHTFPDYERVIPSGNERIATVATTAFHDAVDRVQTISSEKARAVKLAFEAAKVTISAASPDSGRATEEIDAGFEGDLLEIGFNARYILDMIGQLNGDEVRLEMASAAAPTLAVDPTDVSAIFVLMPMRV